MHRGWQDHPVFSRDQFSRRDAWVWIIENAAHRPRSVGVGVKRVELERGQLCHSLRFMAKAWGWDDARVRRFLNRIEAEKMIACVADAGQTLITVCNYDQYQAETCVGDAVTDAASTQRRRSVDANNKKEIREESKEEPIGSSKTRATPPSDAEFDRWYAGYPHKVGRGTARTAYRRARAKATAEALLIGRDFYVRSKPPDRAWCNPATWLNGERWLDQPDHPTERRSDETPGRKPSATESIFAGFAVALGQRERAADRGADRDPARALLDAGDGPDDPLASRH